MVEEYCAEALDIEFLGYRDVHRELNGTRTHWIALDFKVRINPAQAMHSQLPHYFEKYRSQLG